MTITDIADTLARSKGVSQAEARGIVAAVLDAIMDGASAGEVRLHGFGVFRVSDRPARKGRNPQTGDTIVIGASRRIGFTAAKGFKDRVAR